MKEQIINRKTDFTKPEEVVLNFIASAKMLMKKENTVNKGQLALAIIHFYTAFKFHPYINHIYELDKIKHIKEIEKTVEITQTEKHIYTQAIRNLIPVGLWKLQLKNNSWKIKEIQLQRGVDSFSTLFISKRKNNA